MDASKLLDFADLREKEIEVKEWKCTLRVRELGLEEGMALFNMIKGLQEGSAVTLQATDIAQVIAWGVVDENGNRVFSDADVPKLARKNRNALMSIYTEITSLTGEDAEKN